MSDFLDRAFRACDPITLVAVFVSGLGFGAAFLRALTIRAGWSAAAMFVAGSVFFSFCLISRALQGVIAWPGWIGVWVLWLLFTLGTFLAVRWGR